MNSTRDRVIKFLGQGIPPSQVAAALGVTPAWVSQLLAEEDVRQQVAILKAGQLEEAVAGDLRLDKLQNKALDIVEEKLIFVKDAKTAANIFTQLNKANRKLGAQTPETDASSAQQVIINLPKSASLKITVDSRNQVTDIDGQTLAPLPSKLLPELAERIRLESPVVDVVNVLNNVERKTQVTAAQYATTERLRDSDRNRAAVAIENIESKELTTIINGVVCVL